MLALERLIEHSRPRLVGLRLAHNEAPAPAGDALEEEQRIHLENRVAADAVEPFGAEQRPAVFLEPVDHVAGGDKVPVGVEAHHIGQLERRAFLGGNGRAVLQAAPHVDGQRLIRIACAHRLKERLQHGHGALAQHDARLVEHIPDDDALVVRVFRHDVRDHFEVFVAQQRRFQRVIGRQGSLLGGERRASLMIAQRVMLLAQRLWLEIGVLAARQLHLGAEHQHDILTVFRGERQIALQIVHEALLLLEPYVEIDDDADGVKACAFGQRQLAVGGRHVIFRIVLLPLILSVGAVAADKVAAAQPRIAVIPRPRLLLCPLFPHKDALPFPISHSQLALKQRACAPFGSQCALIRSLYPTRP